MPMDVENKQVLVVTAGDELVAVVSMSRHVILASSDAADDVFGAHMAKVVMRKLDHLLYSQRDVAMLNSFIHNTKSMDMECAVHSRTKRMLKLHKWNVEARSFFRNMPMLSSNDRLMQSDFLAAILHWPAVTSSHHQDADELCFSDVFNMAATYADLVASPRRSSWSVY